MKNLQQLCAAFVLTLTLVLSAFAGEMSTGIATPSPFTSQATAQGEMSTTVAGQIDTGVASADSAAEIALNLLQSVLSLF